MDSMFGLEDTAMQQKVSETHVYSKHSSKFFGIYKNTSCKKLSLGRSAEVTKKLIPSSYKSLLLPSASPSPRRFAALGLHSRNPHFLSSLFRFSLLYSRLCRKGKERKWRRGGKRRRGGLRGREGVPLEMGREGSPFTHLLLLRGSQVREREKPFPIPSSSSTLVVVPCGRVG